MIEEEAKRFEEYLRQLGYVKPIRCKDCKYRYIEDKVWRCPFGLSGGPDFWCSYGAERKEE